MSQRRQLSGRVGRGSGKSTCLRLWQGPLGETARARLRIMRQTDGGFRVAEEDLKLLGAGEPLSTRQSGLPEFRLANLAVHDDLMAIARSHRSEEQTSGPHILMTFLYAVILFK